MSAGKTSLDSHHRHTPSILVHSKPADSVSFGVCNSKMTRGNYPHKNSPCRLQCRWEKFHKRLTRRPTVRDKGFYLNVSGGILILGLLQIFNPNSSTSAELIESTLLAFFFLLRQHPVIFLQMFIYLFLYFVYFMCVCVYIYV